MDTGGFRPQADEAGLLIESLGDELLVCDPSRDTAHVLNATAAKVWRACDGSRDLVALQEHCELDRDTVELALQQLRDCGLLSEPEHHASISRREMLRKGVIAAGLGAVLPVIQSVTVPAAAAAAVTRNAPLTTVEPTTTAAAATSTTAAVTTTAMLTTTSTTSTTTTTKQPATTNPPTTTAAPATTPAPTTTAAPVPPPHHPAFDPLVWIAELFRDLTRFLRP
jgi:hypothetical protein